MKGKQALFCRGAEEGERENESAGFSKGGETAQHASGSTHSSDTNHQTPPPDSAVQEGAAPPAGHRALFISRFLILFFNKAPIKQITTIQAVETPEQT